MKKFEDTDIFVNTIKTHPKVKLFGYNGKIYINNTDEEVIKLNDFLQETPPPYVAPTPPPPSQVFHTNSFENSEGWPGTFLNSDYSPSFGSVFSDSFENSGGWPGT